MTYRLLFALSLLFLSSAAKAERALPRTLLIALDAVPFWVIDELTDPAVTADAPFQDFKGPVPLISTFPSSTSVAMVGLLQPLGLEKSPGYEARFFDWQKRQVRGGGLRSYSKIVFPWREFFDWTRKNPAGSAVEALRPVKAGTKRLRRAIDEFATSNVDVSLIYIAATDTAVHVIGPDSVKRLLRDLDEIIREARQRRPDRPFETLIFSDHGVAGGEPLINVAKPTRRALRAAGYELTKKLRKPRSVVMTPFGLVSNFEAYTHAENIPEVARILAGIEGVDLCVHAEAATAWRVISASGAARFERHDAGQVRRWRYETEGEDPLAYVTIVEELARGSSPAGWVADEALFAATVEHHYPDALHRLADAFELVENPASVVCSVGVDYMYGSASTAALAKVGKGRLRWTHGSLHRTATLGFLISDVPDWQPPAVDRYDRALVPFVEYLSRHPNVIDATTGSASDLAEDRARR